MPDQQYIDLDVRPLVAAGQPPLSTILDTVARLRPGQELRLTAPFEPSPLYAVLACEGFEHQTGRSDDGSWVVVFKRRGVG